MLRTTIKTILAGSALAALHPVHATTIQTATITCANCTSLNALEGQAVLHAEAYPIPGTVMIVVSLNAPLAGAFQNTGLKSCPPGPGIQLVCIPIVKALTTTNKAALALSETMFPRGAKMTVPVTVPYAYPETIPGSVSLSIEAAMIFQNSGATNLFHFIIPNDGSLGFTPSGTVEYWDYAVQVPGMGSFVTQIFVGDMVTVTFSNGITARYQFNGAGVAKSKRWSLVPGSEMKDGKPYTPPPPAAATPQRGFGTAEGNSAYGLGGRVLTELDFGSCAGSSSVTITTESGSSTYYGSFSFPCSIP